MITWRSTWYSTLAVTSITLGLCLYLSVGQARAILEPSSGSVSAAMFGGTRPLLAQQGYLGRKLSVVRLYYGLREAFNIRAARQVMAAGTTVIASLDVPTSGPSYASIAAGKHDPDFLAWLKGAEKAAVTYKLPSVYVSFEHEANAPRHKVLGTPAQFVAAWRHLHQLAARAKLNWNSGGRLHWALILEHYAYATAAERPRWSLPLGYVSHYWPGSQYVDDVAADGYNRGGCRIYQNTSYPSQPAVTPSYLFDPALRWATGHSKPLLIAEWGSAYFSKDPAFQSRFITQMNQYVLGHPQVKAISYWDQYDPRGTHPCQFQIDHNPLALTAMKTLGQVTR